MADHGWSSNSKTDADVALWCHNRPASAARRAGEDLIIDFILDFIKSIIDLPQLRGAQARISSLIPFLIS